MSESAVGYVYNEATDSIFISHPSNIPNAESLPAQGRFHYTHEIVYDITLYVIKYPSEDQHCLVKDDFLRQPFQPTSTSSQIPSP